MGEGKSSRPVAANTCHTQRLLLYKNNGRDKNNYIKGNWRPMLISSSRMIDSTTSTPVTDLSAQ